MIAVGEVHVFDANSGKTLFTINNPEPNNADAFGNYVVFYDGKIIVGSPGNDAQDNENSGTVYLFDSSTGSILKTIDNPEPTKSYVFGNSIAVVNGKMIIGAPQKQVGSKSAAGGVYIFDASTGLLLKTIDNPDPDTAEYFGKRIMSVGNNFAVAAPDAGLYKSGKVFIFNGDTGSLVKTIDSPQKNFPTEVGYNNEFGDAMAYKDGKLVIGDRGKVLDNVINAGGVYVYDATTWKLVQTIDNPQPVNNDSFGNFVSFVGDVEPSQESTPIKKQELSEIPSDSYTFEYYPGLLKFDTDLGKLSCGPYKEPKTLTARSLDIDGMDGYFFIIVGKINSAEHNYLQIPIPEKKKSNDTPSYLLDFRNETAKIRGEFYQGYDQLAIYLQTDKNQYTKNLDYTKFLVGQSKKVSPSSESFGPGQYNLHTVLFQSDRDNWIKDDVCAISLNWPISVDSNGNITTGQPQMQSGKIYPIETNKEALDETDKIIENPHNENYSVNVEESLSVNSKTQDDMQPEYVSPLKQLTSGIQPDEIICKDGLKLVIKTDHRHHPICVNPDTKSKMIQRGLAMTIQIAH